MTVERDSIVQLRSPEDLDWWQRGVVYQVWVRPFYDRDGDLNGVTAKLDALKWLGIDVIWLSPIYPSPLVESGYHISDYTGVHELFGSREDFDRLLAEAHARGMRVILDFEPSHTSDAHPWFVESRSGRDSPKRDLYLWHDPKEDGRGVSGAAALGGACDGPGRAAGRRGADRAARRVGRRQGRQRRAPLAGRPRRSRAARAGHGAVTARGRTGRRAGPRGRAGRARARPRRRRPGGRWPG